MFKVCEKAWQVEIDEENKTENRKQKVRTNL